jgi:hypothetical protein
MRETSVLGWSLLYMRVKHVIAVATFFVLPFTTVALAGVLIVVKILQ